MKAQRREHKGKKGISWTVANAVSKCVPGKTQAKPIKNNVNSPQAVGYSKVHGAVSG